MKKLTILLFSIFISFNSYAAVMACTDVNDYSTCSLPIILKKIDNWECNEGYIKYGYRCYKEGEEIPQEEIRIILDENGQIISERIYKDGECISGNLTLYITWVYTRVQIAPLT